MIKKWKNINYRNLNCRKHGCQNCKQDFKICFFVCCVIWPTFMCMCAFSAVLSYFSSFCIFFFFSYKKRWKSVFLGIGSFIYNGSQHPQLWLTPWEGGLYFDLKTGTLHAICRSQEKRTIWTYFCISSFYFQ